MTNSQPQTLNSYKLNTYIYVYTYIYIHTKGIGEGVDKAYADLAKTRSFSMLCIFNSKLQISIIVRNSFSETDCKQRKRIGSTSFSAAASMGNTQSVQFISN